MFTRPFSTAFMTKTTPVREESLSDLDGILAKNEHYYAGFKHQETALAKNQYLHELFIKHEALFYRFVQRHLKEMLPILYTPTVGEVVKQFKRVRTQTSGLYVAWQNRASIETLLEPYPAGSINIAVITDGERILGLGDQGMGGIEICIAKAMMYVICARLAPHRLLPIYLDVGTNNKALLEDPNYPGWRHTRLNEKDYDQFVDQLVTVLNKKFPNIYLHWEDLARDNANRLLTRYQPQYCLFNDDIQGTGVVTLASALTAMKIAQVSLTEQRIVIFGGGTAGLGVADQLCGAMQRMGLTLSQARKRIWLIGRYGLLFKDSGNLTPLQAPYARPIEERMYYQDSPTGATIELLSVVQHVKPSFLIGTSGIAGAFTQQVITTMANGVDRPIIFPLSNPSACCEATPQDILNWTQNRALIATGSPFNDADIQGRTPFDRVGFENKQRWPISQCNNALVFPGIGLGIQASGASQLTDEMLWQACIALCEATPDSIDYPILLPNMTEVDTVSERIACAIYQTVQKEKGLAALSKHRVMALIRAQYWNALI